MSEDKDFSALGRYVDAKERMQRGLQAQKSLTGEIASMLRATDAEILDTIFPRKLDIAAIQAKLDDLADVNFEVIRAAEDLNANAVAANRKPLRKYPA